MLNPRASRGRVAQAVYVGDAGGGEREAGAAVLPPAPTGADIEAVLGGLGEVRVPSCGSPCSRCARWTTQLLWTRMKTVIHSEVRCATRSRTGLCHAGGGTSR